MLYGLIVSRILSIDKCTALIFIFFLQLLDRHPYFPQEHFGNVAGCGSQAGNGVQGIEVQNTLEVLKTQTSIRITAAAD
ncbi:hypothetical protein [Dehalobacter sp. TBBPA1]|uniref:hypothetical protein n=1 Tax=Dehalobacter sp. TBBPA1 TaxID=3235037 RepID=UPI0034A4A1E3